MKTLTTLLLLLAYTQTYAQVDGVYTNPQTPNAFIGGEDALMNVINTRFDFCKNTQSKESIIVRFVVEPDGTYSNLIFISKNAETVKQMVKDLMDSLPQWKPGTVQGKPVRSYRHIVIRCENGERVR